MKKEPFLMLHLCLLASVLFLSGCADNQESALEKLQGHWRVAPDMTLQDYEAYMRERFPASADKIDADWRNEFRTSSEVSGFVLEGDTMTFYSKVLPLEEDGLKGKVHLLESSDDELVVQFIENGSTKERSDRLIDSMSQHMIVVPHVHGYKFIDRKTIRTFRYKVIDNKATKKRVWLGYSVRQPGSVDLR